MKIKKVILYKKLNKKIFQEYSRFKFGEQIIIKKYTTKLVKLIKKYIKNNKDYIIYTTNKAPITKYCKKNSLILSEKIAEKLKLPLVVAEYKYYYDKKKFYDNSLERKIHPPIIKNINKLKKYNYHVLMIDDSISSGNTLKASINQLEQIANKITFFSIINLKNQKYSEEEINNFYYKKRGLSFLLKLLKSKNYIPTSQFIRVVDGLGRKDKKLLFKNLNKSQRTLLKKAFSIYTDKNLSEIKD